MYGKSSSRNFGTLFLMLLAGLVLGSFIGHFIGGFPSFAWLRYGQEFGIAEPFALELFIIKLSFSLLVKINIAGVIGLAIAILVYKRM